MGQGFGFLFALCAMLSVISMIYGQALSELDQSLVDAARAGELETVVALIDDGARVNVIDDSGTTPLHWAVFGEHQDVTKKLLAEGALVNVPDNDGFTPLDTVAKGGYTKLVQILIKAGANLEARDNLGGTALYAAAGKGYTSIVKMLLNAGAEVESRFTKTDDTALLFASAEGHDEVVSLLVEAGADVTATNRAGFFPLYQAALRGHDAVIKVLLEAGALPNDPLEKDGETPLMAAAFGGHAAAVQALVDGGADVDAQNSRSKTALHQAPLLVDSEEVVQALVDAGAAVNPQDNKANTPLHIAAQFGAKEIVSYLVAVGADPEALNGDRLTPGEVACDCLEFTKFPSSLQCPQGKCDDKDKIDNIRKIIDGSRTDTDTIALDDTDDDDGPGGLPPNAADLPLLDPSADGNAGGEADSGSGTEFEASPPSGA